MPLSVSMLLIASTTTTSTSFGIITTGSRRLLLYSVAISVSQQQQHQKQVAAFVGVPTTAPRLARASSRRICQCPPYRYRSLSVLAFQNSLDADERVKNVSNERDSMYEIDGPLSAASSASASILSATQMATATAAQSSSRYSVKSRYEAAGDQPEAIRQLTEQMLGADGDRYSILRGITGTGKTFVMANVIANLNKPCLVLCHNKTLAAQLARELRSFLPENAVELFVSYYNNYTPESFVETTGKYIAKKSSVNAELDALRHRATRALLTRSDVVVVSSVSCIYGLGLPKEYLDNSIQLSSSAEPNSTNKNRVSWLEFANQLETMLYTLSMDDEDFTRGQYQLTERDPLARNPIEASKIITLWSPHDQYPMQILLEQVVGDNYDIVDIRIGNRKGFSSVDSTHIFPAKHHVTSEDKKEKACRLIEDEMMYRVRELRSEEKSKEAELLQTRVTRDLEMIRDIGYCSGIENYSRHFAGREKGEPPDTLIDYFGLASSKESDRRRRDWLLIVDESHVTLPQLNAMYEADQSRKRKLVKHGYRLPSALDNRPLQASEFWDQIDQALFVSATPSTRELEMTVNAPVEMIIRPTFVCDPLIEVRSSDGQLQDLLQEIQSRAVLDQKTLVIALTKRDAEDLSSFLVQNEVASNYIHSGLTTHERSDALKALQSGKIDCLVGVNLLREGLDLPQVTLVAILNADSQGFLRSDTALFQNVGRAARNIDGKAILYATGSRITESMRKCIDETKRRRTKQLAHNEQYGKTSVSTVGSSTMSIFDLAREEIDTEMTSSLLIRPPKKCGEAEAEAFLSEFSKTNVLSTPATDGSSKNDPPGAFTTDHIPNSPGIYMWRDANDKILYIGKAVNLRSRVRSYRAKSARHSSRITAMLKKSSSVDFVLTPTERDALVLESNLIKHHQPPFNVLLKDDEHYPFICASCGEDFPRLFVTPFKLDGTAAQQKFRYFGPYTNFKEINVILERVEETYGIRAQSFLARHGSVSKDEYQRLFNSMMQEVFTDTSSIARREPDDLKKLRLEYEQAGLLFDSTVNQCRDVVAVGGYGRDDLTIAVVVLQLRNGIVASRFSYSCQVTNKDSPEEDYPEAIIAVLVNRHYPSGGESHDGVRWFPDDILLSHEPKDVKDLQRAIRQLGNEAMPKKRNTKVSSKLKSKSKNTEVDRRTLEFATKNANQVALVKSAGAQNIGLFDGTGSAELAQMVGVEKAPSRIECFVRLVDTLFCFCGATRFAHGSNIRMRCFVWNRTLVTHKALLPSPPE